MNDLKQNPKLIEAGDELIRKTLKVSMTDNEIDNYMLERSKLLDPIDAELEIKMVAVDGKLKCSPKDTNKYPYVWEHRVFGFGLINLKCEGLLGTGYKSWDNFWSNTTSIALTSVNLEFGIVGIIFFRKDGMPIGDFRSVNMGSLGFMAGGAAGGWERK